MPLLRTVNVFLTARAAWRRLRFLRRDWLGREYGVGGGSALFAAAFVVSAALGVLRQVLFGAQFGAGMEANAYYAAFRLPETLAMLVAGGTLSQALMPVLLTTTRDDGTAAGHRLLSLVLTTLTVLVLPILLLCVLLAPAFVAGILAPGFDPPTQALTVVLTRIMLAEVLFAITFGVLSTLLLSRNQFLLPALALALHNLTLIGGILAARYLPGVGIYGPTIGAITDSLLQITLLVPGLRRLGWRYHFVWAPADRRLRAVGSLLLPRAGSAGVNYVGAIVDTAYASLTREAAALPALHNAFLLLGVPLRLIGVACAQAAFPRMAAHAAAGEWRGLRRLLRLLLLATAFLALLATSATLLLGRPAVRLLFERGRYTAAMGDLTSEVLAIYALALPAAIVGEVATAALLALRDTRSPLLVNCLQLFCRAALVPLLLPTLGVLAIPSAFALASLLESALLLAILHRSLRRLP